MELSSLTPDLPALLADMGACYDPERLAAALADRPGDLAARALRVATSLGGFITLVVADVASGSLEGNAATRAVQLRRALTQLGPSFVKVGGGVGWGAGGRAGAIMGEEVGGGRGHGGRRACVHEVWARHPAHRRASCCPPSTPALPPPPPPPRLHRWARR